MQTSILGSYFDSEGKKQLFEGAPREEMHPGATHEFQAAAGSKVMLSAQVACPW